MAEPSPIFKFLLQPLVQSSPTHIIEVLDTDSSTCFFFHRFLGFQYEFVTHFLERIETAASRNGAGNICMHGHPAHPEIQQNQFVFFKVIVIFHVMQNGGVVPGSNDRRKTQAIRRVHQHLTFQEPLHLAFVVEILKPAKRFLKCLSGDRLGLEGIRLIISIQGQAQFEMGIHDIDQRPFRSFPFTQEAFQLFFEHPVVVCMNYGFASIANSFQPKRPQLFFLLFAETVPQNRLELFNIAHFLQTCNPLHLTDTLRVPDPKPDSIPEFLAGVFFLNKQDLLRLPGIRIEKKDHLGLVDSSEKHHAGFLIRRGVGIGPEGFSTGTVRHSGQHHQFFLPGHQLIATLAKSFFRITPCPAIPKDS